MGEEKMDSTEVGPVRKGFSGIYTPPPFSACFSLFSGLEATGAALSDAGAAPSLPVHPAHARPMHIARGAPTMVLRAPSVSDPGGAACVKDEAPKP